MGNEDFLSSQIEIAKTTGQSFSSRITSNPLDFTNSVDPERVANHRDIGTHSSDNTIFDN